MRHRHFDHDEPPTIYEEDEDSPYAWMEHAIQRSRQHIRNQVGRDFHEQKEEQFHEAMWQQTASIWFLGTELSRIRIALEDLQNVLRPIEQKRKK